MMRIMEPASDSHAPPAGEQRADGRRAPRRPLNLTIRSRLNSRAVFVSLIDISETGCKVRGSLGFAEVGDRVTMNVGGIHAPLGTIAWVIDHHAGVAFEGEMHPAIVDHLCAANGVQPGALN